MSKKKKKDKHRYQFQSEWPRQSGSVWIKKLSVGYKRGKKNPSNSVYSQRFDHVLHISFFLFIYLCARLGCAMKKCQKVWFPWQKPSTYGRLLETFHMVLKEKKLIKIFHFLLQSLSLSVCLCSSWVGRILSHDCWGEFWFIMFCYH